MMENTSSARCRALAMGTIDMGYQAYIPCIVAYKMFFTQLPFLYSGNIFDHSVSFHFVSGFFVSRQTIAQRKYYSILLFQTLLCKHW